MITPILQCGVPSPWDAVAVRQFSGSLGLIEEDWVAQNEWIVVLCWNLFVCRFFIDWLLMLFKQVDEDIDSIFGCSHFLWNASQKSDLTPAPHQCGTWFWNPPSMLCMISWAPSCILWSHTYATLIMYTHIVVNTAIRSREITYWTRMVILSWRVQGFSTENVRHYE